MVRTCMVLKVYICMCLFWVRAPGYDAKLLVGVCIYICVCSSHQGMVWDCWSGCYSRASQSRADGFIVGCRQLRTKISRPKGSTHDICEAGTYVFLERGCPGGV